MGKPYKSEMSRLAESFRSAMATKIDDLRSAVRKAGLSPLVAVGSGGSLTVAHALAALHRHLTGRLATVATPLEAMAEVLEPQISYWLLSAGGGNVDIIAAFRALVEREPRHLAILCGRGNSPLAKLARSHPFCDLLVHQPPTGKDGFLATNSLFIFVSLLVRAYIAEFRHDKGARLEQVISSVVPILDLTGRQIAQWRTLTEPLWSKDTTLVLYGSSSTRIGAIDLESKFSEAAIGNIQIADWRNFAHGRHHWLAKRGDSSGVLALVGPDDSKLADKTLSLIPETVPRARLEFSGPWEGVLLACLATALQVVGWAGEARQIDPGRPGVPEFGRKLYRLSLPKFPPPLGTTLKDRDAAAIERKARAPFSILEQRGETSGWIDSLAQFRLRLLDARFKKLVLDYDGTLVDTRDRFAPPDAEIIKELVRLLDAGALIGIATGRGRSVFRDLRASLPSSLWPSVLIGYYNGANIRRLDEEMDLVEGVCPELAEISIALREHRGLNVLAYQTDRKFQITLEAKQPLPERELWRIVHEVVQRHRHANVLVTRSSHSIDIVAPGVSKLNLVRKLGDDGKILTIGDRGRWPGNDFELLCEPLSLSVDEVSADPQTCWNLAERGQRGTQVTLQYLRAIQIDRPEDKLRFKETAFE